MVMGESAWWLHSGCVCFSLTPTAAELQNQEAQAWRDSPGAPERAEKKQPCAPGQGPGVQGQGKEGRRGRGGQGLRGQLPLDRRQIKQPCSRTSLDGQG